MTPKANNLLNALLRKKPVALFLAVSDESSGSYCLKLSIKARCTYSHVLGLLAKMREAGLLTIERQGKNKHARLTAKGIRLSERLKEFMDCLSEKNIR